MAINIIESESKFNVKGDIEGTATYTAEYSLRKAKDVNRSVRNFFYIQRNNSSEVLGIGVGESDVSNYMYALALKDAKAFLMVHPGTEIVETLRGRESRLRNFFSATELDLK